MFTTDKKQCERSLKNSGAKMATSCHNETNVDTTIDYKVGIMTTVRFLQYRLSDCMRVMSMFHACPQTSKNYAMNHNRACNDIFEHLTCHLCHDSDFANHITPALCFISLQKLLL